MHLRIGQGNWWPKWKSRVWDAKVNEQLKSVAEGITALAG
jgi:hypothetical protein